MSKRIDTLRGEIAEQAARATALAKLAETEKRDLTAEEVTEVDAILGTEGKPGVVAALQTKLDREVKLDVLTRTVLGQKLDTGNGFETEPQPFKVPARAIRGNLKAFKGPDAERDAYASGQWLAANVFGNVKAREWCDTHGVQAAMSTSENTKGGFTVPDQLESAVIRLVEEYGVIRSNVGRVWPMPNGSIKVPKRNGGFTGYWLGENSAITASDMAFAQVSLVAKKLGVLAQIPSELLEDSAIALAELVATEFAFLFANKEDEAGFNGDGTSTYGGIVGLKNAVAAGSVQDAISGNTAFSTLDREDFEACIGKLPMYVGIQPKWYIHSAGWGASMQRLANAAGGNTNETLASGASQKMFMGYPVVFSQVMLSALTAQVSTICCYFGDMSMAVSMGEARGMTVAASSDKYFAEDAIALRGTKRLDITVSDPGTASACGAMVALKLAS